MDNKPLSKIPTAEEYIRSQKWADGDQLDIKQMAEYARFIAKLHVEAALKAAKENALMRQKSYKGSWTVEGSYLLDDHTELSVDEESILTAYPLTNIV